MTRQDEQGKPRVGDRYRIRARYDKGGYPVIRVQQVMSNDSVLVQAYSDDGTPMFWGGVGERPYVIPDARHKLTKYWRRLPPHDDEVRR